MSKGASSITWMWYEKVMRNAPWIVKLFSPTGEEIHLTYIIKFRTWKFHKHPNIKYILKDFQCHLKGLSGQIRSTQDHWIGLG